MTSVGALWHAGSCWFQTGQHTRKAKNVARDKRCTISVATKSFDVMVAGQARRVHDSSVVAEIAALWAKGRWTARSDKMGNGITASCNAPALGRLRDSCTRSSLRPRLRSARVRKRQVQHAGASEINTIAIVKHFNRTSLTRPVITDTNVEGFVEALNAGREASVA